MRPSAAVRIGTVVTPLVLLSLAACGPKPSTAGSTGAFGVVTVTVNGKQTQKLYLPLTELNAAGHGQIAVVDVGVAGSGVAGASAQITAIDLGTSDFATTTGGDATTVVAASTASRTIWFIDPVTDTVTKTISLDPSAGYSGFSGGGGYVTGVATDSTNHRAILSVWNGFNLVDLKAQAITQLIEAPPSENFGFDESRQRIYAPFYQCSSSRDSSYNPPPFCDSFTATDGSPMTDGLNVIDLKDATVYTYQDASASSPSQPVGSEPDSAAADSSTGVVVVPSEGDGFQNFLDFGRASFDKANKRVTAPHHRIQNTGLTGVAVEPNQHLAFFEEEHSQDVGVVDVNAANGGGGTFLHAFMPTVPDGSSWSNMGDPHGIAVTAGIRDGRAVGFVVDSTLTWVARVDLQKLASLPSIFGEVNDMSPAVTYLNARQRP